jgi:chromosome partitioning protein
MMKIIAAVNNKGGVGKTKISELMSEYLSKYKNKRVLAIDCDPQCNFSHRYLKMDIDPVAPEGTIPPIHPDYDPTDSENGNWDGRSSIADIFFDQSIAPYPTYIKNLDIAPGRAERLLAAEAVRKAEVAEKIHRRLKDFLSGEDIRDAYDVVVIDTAPSKGPLTISVIKSATDIVIPSVMEAQPIQGVYGMLQLWMQESLARNKTESLNLIGILPNMFKHTTLHEDMLQSLLENPSIGKYVLPVKLGHRISFAEVDSEGASPRSIFDLPDSTAAKQEALEVCKCITKRIFNHE